MTAIAVVAPEPVFWLDGVIASASRVAPVEILAPWAMPPMVLDRAGAMPEALARFVRRRGAPQSVPCVSLPGWSLAEGGLRAWVRGRTDRNMSARFWVRRAVDAWAARWLARARVRPRVILAPSLAARSTLAAAARLGIARVLIEDVPDIRGLHRDLDEALERHPGCRFLGRYRAPHALLVRQEVERVLADRLVVRGGYARDQRVNAGTAEHCVADLPGDAASVRKGPDVSVLPSAVPSAVSSVVPSVASNEPIRILLAGLATARHGTVDVLAALMERPELELLVRAGEGLEPAGLLDHPRVRAATADELTELRGVHAVIAPAWCETYPRELALAAARGIATVATRRAAGFSTPTHRIERGDITGLGRALDQVVTGRPIGVGVGVGVGVRDAKAEPTVTGTGAAGPDRRALSACLAELLDRSSDSSSRC